jgi:hypothetical protein
MSARHRGVAVAFSVLACLTIAAPSRAQRAGGPAAAAPRAAAPVDLTGYWVSFVTEDWRHRMITPPKGDYRSVPMTPEARKIADAWNPAADQAAGESCKAYGAPALMRVPTRLHVTWQDDNTLKIETDAGTQTRVLNFRPVPPPEKPTLQGHSVAEWERPAPARGVNPSAAPSGGNLKVVTHNLRAGYLRKNGVPYSENAVLTEYFDVSPLPNGGQLLMLTAVVDDPRFLQTPFIVTSQFKKEADASRWEPTPCSAF